MNQLFFRSLVAIDVLAVLFIPQSAQAGWVRQAIEAYQNSQQRTPSYIVRPNSATPLNSIDRSGYGYVHQLGGGVDDAGNYNTPVPTNRAFGVDLPDGTYEAPASWDENLGIQYGVQGGQIRTETYRFHRRGQ